MSRAASDFERIVIGTYNVHCCIGSDGRHDPDRAAAVIQEMEVDAIALQEVCSRASVENGIDQFEYLARATGPARGPVGALMADAADGPDGHASARPGGVTAAAGNASGPAVRGTVAAVTRRAGEPPSDTLPLCRIASSCGLPAPVAGDGGSG